MIRLLDERAKAGVEIKILGRLTRPSSNFSARRLSHIRLHSRTIIRDGQKAFIGSQSLRKLELEEPGAVGLSSMIKVVSQLVATFQEDWDTPEQVKVRSIPVETDPGAKVAKKVAKALTKDLPPVQPLLEAIVEETVGQQTNVKLDARSRTLKEAK